jgi:hypothetical protein
VRTGVPAWLVTLIHVGFAAFGGLVALLFIAVSGEAKAWIPLLTLGPQLIWLTYVIHRSRRRGSHGVAIGRW